MDLRNRKQEKIHDIVMDKPIPVVKAGEMKQVNQNRNAVIITSDLTVFGGLLAILSILPYFTATMDFVLGLSMAVILATYLFARYYNNNRVIEIFHVLWAVEMVLIPFCISNREFQFLYLLIIFITLATRKIFGSCMISELEDANDSPITENWFTQLFNWDLIFPVLGAVSAYQLYTFP